MNALKWILASAVFGLSSPLLAGDMNGIVVSHYEPLQRLSMHAVGSETDQKFRGQGPITLSFDALGRSFDLQLEPNAGLLAPASRNALPDGIEIYRGKLAGSADSWARIVVLDGMPRGLVWDGEQLLAIEAPDDSALQTTSPVIYRLADTFIEPGSMSCGTAPASGNGAAVFGKLMGEISASKARGPGATTNIDIGAIGDLDFTTAKGGDINAAAAITTRLNNVDGIFSQQLGVQLTIQELETFSDPVVGDPFSTTTDALTLLGELAAYRQATPAQNTQGLTHLYTGRTIATSTVGIAYGGAICHPFFGAGLSEGNVDPTFDSLIAAHEIGHNFGAPHDGDPIEACAAEPLTFLMAPLLNSSNQFSPCSIAEMQIVLASPIATCVTALPSIDMTIALNGQLPTALLGNSATLNFNVTNNGTIQATNVSTDITLPNNVSFVSASASVGTCSNNAGTVNCQIGDVPGVTGRTVIVSTITTAVGTGLFNATVMSDVDDNANNNQQSVQLTVDPAVNLVVNTPTAATIIVGQSTTVGSVLENQSDLDATGVTVIASIGAGLQVDSATWSIGTCTIAAQQVDCQTNNFASQSTSTLNIGVTGITAGSKSYSIAMSSTEPDISPANNSFAGVMTVNSENGDDDDGGAGAVGLTFLSMLGLTLFWRRRRGLQQQ